MALLFRLAALCVAQAAIARAVVYGPFNTSWQYPTFAEQTLDGGTAECSWDAPLSDMLTNDGNGTRTVSSLEPPRISWSIRTGVYDFSSMPDTASVTGLNYRIETCQNGGWRVDLWRLGTAFGVTAPTWAEKDTDVPDDCGSRTALTYGDGSTTDNLGLPLLAAAQYKIAFFRWAVQFRGVGAGGGAGPFVFVYWSQLKIFWTLTTSITSTSPTSLVAATGGPLTVNGGDFELIPDHDIKCRFDGSQVVAGTRQSSTAVRCDAPAIPSACTRNVPVEISLDGVTFTNSVAVEYTGSLGGCTPSAGSGTTGNSPPVTTGGAAQPSSTTGVVGSGGPATTGIGGPGVFTTTTAVGGSGVSATTTAVGGSGVSTTTAVAGSGVSATTGVAVSATSSSMTQQTSSVTSTSSTGTSAGGGTQPPPITTAGANAADSTADEEDGGAGLIVGIIVAVAVVLCVVAIVAAVVVLRKKGDSEEGSGRSEDGNQHAELDEKPGPALPAETSSSSDEDGGVEVYANVGDMDVDDSDSEPGNPADITSPEVVYANLDQFRPSETPGGGVDSPGNIVYAELGEFKDITV